ncbi:hypothetical protein C1890_31620 [Pseudomonas sp. DP16D-R1]|nr:hypothetical protein C1890_31620 [Pseudomonas sp. DP16D-R1]
MNCNGRVSGFFIPSIVDLPVEASLLARVVNYYDGNLIPLGALMRLASWLAPAGIHMPVHLRRAWTL